MIFSNHMAGAFPPPSPLSMSPYVVLQSDHRHVHDQHQQRHHDVMRRSVSFSGGMMEHGHEFNNGFPNGCGGGGGDDDLSDEGSQMLGEKKKRLSMEQVQALERSFETRNKLETERKTQLARSLGLQPRQVAIWFQNRRARWKTKQLERDYEVLKRQVEVLRADNDALHAQNEKLHAEIMAIKTRRDMSELKPSHVKNATSAAAAAAEGSYRSNNGSDGSCDVNPDISRTSLIDSLKLDQHDVFGNGAAVDGFWPWTVAAAADHLPLNQS